ncbi:hypothetical protein BaRGS_00001664 [Batillaria attramentaria]|uniref:Uncharacterized protein n=1 Tax=Batillaria attramentaria TaxID=370345 RepID=A0ABD0M4Z6_9CAEN
MKQSGSASTLAEAESGGKKRRDRMAVARKHERTGGGMSVVQKLLLNAQLLGNEANTNFEQLYTVPNLQLLGMPLKLVSLTAVVAGPVGTLLMPLLGWLSDKGSNPNRRKMMTVILCMALLVSGVFCVVLANVLHLQSRSNPIPAAKDATDLKGRESNTSPRYSSKIQTAYQRHWNVTADGKTGPPFAAQIGLLAFVLLDVGFDLTNAFVKAWVLTCSPRAEHTSVLMMGTAIGSVGGLVTSTLAVVDFDVSLFGLGDNEGMGLAVQVCVQAIAVLFLVLAGSVLTILVGYRQLQSKTENLEKGSIDEDNVKPKRADHTKANDCDESKQPLLQTRKTMDQAVHQGVPADYGSGQRQTGDPVAARVSPVTDVCYRSATCTYADGTCESFHRSADIRRQRSAPVTHGNGSDPVAASDSSSVGVTCNSRFHIFRSSQNTFKWKIGCICASLYFSVGLVHMFSMMSTDYVGKTIYGGNPEAEPGSDSLRNYQTGVRFASVGFIVYYISYLLASACHKRVHQVLGYLKEYALVQMSASACMVTLALTARMEVYFLLCILAGFQRASYFVIPYAVTNDLIQAQAQESGRDGGAKLGLFMSLVSGMIPLAYSTIFTSVGPLEYITGDVSTPLWLGAACGCLSTICFLPVGYL